MWSRSKTYRSIARYVGLIYRPRGKTVMACVKRNEFVNSPDGLLEQGPTRLANFSYTNTARNDTKLCQSGAMHIYLIYGLEGNFIMTCVRRNNFATSSDNPLEHGLVKLFVLFRHAQTTNYNYFYIHLHVKASTFFWVLIGHETRRIEGENRHLLEFLLFWLRRVRARETRV